MLFRQFQHANGRLSHLVVCRTTRAALLVDPVPPAASVYKSALAETRANGVYCVYTGSVPAGAGLEGATTIRLGPERDTAVGVRVGGAVAVLAIDAFKGAPGPIVPGNVPDIVPSIALLLGRNLVDVWVVRAPGVRILLQVAGRLFGAELVGSGAPVPASYAWLDPDTIVCPRHRFGQLCISSVAQETGWNSTLEPRPANPDAIVSPLRRADEEDTHDMPTNESVEDLIRRFPPRGPATRRNSVWDP